MQCYISCTHIPVHNANTRDSKAIIFFKASFKSGSARGPQTPPPHGGRTLQCSTGTCTPGRPLPPPPMMMAAGGVVWNARGRQARLVLSSAKANTYTHTHIHTLTHMHTQHMHTPGHASSACADNSPALLSEHGMMPRLSDSASVHIAIAHTHTHTHTLVFRSNNHNGRERNSK